eukprot:6171858-Pleurochrysis_carterae.AAC.1
MLSSDADITRSLSARHALTVATGPLAHTPPAPSSSSVFSCVTAFPREPNRAFCGGKPKDSFDYGRPTPFFRSNVKFRSLCVPESSSPLQHLCGPVLGHLTFKSSWRRPRSPCSVQQSGLGEAGDRTSFSCPV